MAEIIVSIVIPLVSGVAKCLAPSVERKISYLRDYKINFQKLKEEVEKLNTESRSIQSRVDAAENNVEEIEDKVQKWLEEASKIINEEAAKQIREDEEAAGKKRCFMGLCPYLKKRYQLSKGAAEQHGFVSQLLEEAKGFERRQISHPIVLKPLPNEGFEAFKSRESILRDVTTSLSDPHVNVVLIYGMGGIGKTTLAKEVAKQAEKHFGRVVFAEVSERPDVREIQGQIADALNFKLDKETERGRAMMLHERLKREKILVILDNIWKHLDLEDVGIPLTDGQKGCKVLLTARSVDVLKSEMGSQKEKKTFAIDFLNDEESWSLFKKMAGDCVERPDLRCVATNVVKECAGLPISIVTVGSALRDKELDDWNDALLKLRSPSSTNYEGIQEKAYSAIELSYNLLKGPELKKIFLLIGYTYITLVDDLLMYGVGLGLFQDIYKMEQAQARVRSLVNTLKASCMLFDDKKNVEDFIMHDVVRDVAISIASRDQRLLTTRSQDVNQGEISRLMSQTPKSYNSVVLIDTEIHELPEVLECPQLKLFSIRDRNSSLKLSDNFFKKMIDLRVLDLTYMDLLSLPPSLRDLTNLQTLCLYRCKLDNIAVIGDLKNLEILFIQDSDIEQLPVAVGQLTNLRSLELRDCKQLSVISPNVISRLSHLEELRLDLYAEWEVDGLNNGRSNASLDELKHLSHLTALYVCIKDAKTLPRDFSLFKNLARYRICLMRRPWMLRHTSKNTSRDICRQLRLELTNTNICLNEGHIMQLNGIQDLHLAGLQDMRNVLYGLDREGFQQLKYLKVEDNPNLLCIIDSMEHITPKIFPLLESLSLFGLTNMEKICRGHLTAEFFGKLRDINVVNCGRIKNILPSSISRGLQQLQSIRVYKCQNVEEIFAVRKEDESNNNTEGVDVLKFGQLRSLQLICLPNFISFCSRSSQQRREGSNEIILVDDINIPPCTLFDYKVALPNLENMELYQVNIERIWQNQLTTISCGIQNLTRLIISGCSNLRCLFSSSIANSFVQLQHLDICECPILKEIVVVHDGLIEVEEERKNVEFPQLEFLRMKSLKNLTKFCSSDCMEFPSLKELKIEECPEFKGFIVKTMTTDLTEISLFNEKVALPSLEKLSVKHCDKLQTIFPRSTYKKFLRLGFLSVHNCGSLEVMFDLEGLHFEDKQRAVTQLSELDIDGLPKLKHVWNMDPKNFLSFQNLKRVRIDTCDELRNVFPVSIASSLLELESLDISRCGVEEIVFVSKEGAETNTIFMFPRVSSLTLHCLPRCMTFFPAKHTTEWPALEQLVISGWEIVKIFNSEFFSLEGQLDITAQQVQFLIEKVFPNLTEIIVKGKGIATMMHQFPEDLHCKLKFLMFEFDESTDLLSLDFLSRLRRIKMLKIAGNGQYIFPNKEVENGISSWITYLNKCSCLKHILKEETNMDHLVDLEIGACDNLVDLVPSSTSFHNLTTLELSYCDGLTNIITSSTAKSLVQLRIMDFFECNMITEIVAAYEGDATKDHQIVFKELKKLSLTCLKSLTSFCLGSCSFNFPSLEALRVIKCPKMNIFCSGELNTPNLQKVKQDWDDEAGCWTGDLNSTIQQLHEKLHNMNTISYDSVEDVEGNGIVEEDEEESDKYTNAEGSGIVKVRSSKED